MSKQGFLVTYNSHRSLEADHSAYMTHGGMMVMCSESEAPSQESPIVVRIAVGSRTFDIAARAGHYIKNRGVMVSFDAGGSDQQGALDEWVVSQDFRSAMRGESEASIQKPAVSRFNPGGAGFIDAPGEDQTDPYVDDGGSGPKTLRPRGRTSSFVEPSSELPMPMPGDQYVVYVVKFSSVGEYVEHLPMFEDEQLFVVPFEDPEAVPNVPCQLRITLPGHTVYKVWSVIETVEPRRVLCRCSDNDDAYRRAVLHPKTVHSKARLARETAADREGIKVIRLVEELPSEDPDKMPIRRRLARMGMDDKINLALSGDREERMALAMDSNKAIHHYLLKNAKITLDEIAFMARLPSLNPDVLERIAENPSYVQNPTVAKALIFNPRTPVRTAIRLLDRLPRSEVMNLAKRTNMNMRLVMAAKKRLERRST